MKENKTLFTHDAATAVFKDDANGISLDENGNASFDWNEVKRVRVDDVPWADAFETTEFYKLPATVAKPIPQKYRFGKDELTLKKPRQELKQGAWSLHNAPWTLGHPNSRMVRKTEDIRGFWRNPRYIDSMDNLDADLLIPVNDEEAKNFIEQNSDVSVGFYNKVTAVDSYDGVVGGADDRGGVDGYQTDMYFDHVASVPVGRCSEEEGCGIQDGPDDGTITDASSIHESRVLLGDSASLEVEAPDEGEYDYDPFVDVWENGDEVLYERKDGAFISDTVTTYDYRDEDGTYYAVAPDENPDGVPKYPITSCSGEDSVASAWKLRGHGDISISQETLEERIKRRASALDCDSVPWDDGEESEDSTDTMSETEETTETTDCGGLGLADLSVDAIAAKHDGVQAEIDAKEEKIEELENKLEEVQDKASQVDDLQEIVDEYKAEEKQEIVDSITDLTDKWDEEELLDEDLDELEDKHELVTELSADEQTANGGGDENTGVTVTGPRRTTPWD